MTLLAMVIVMWLACLLDWRLGEPRRWHPLVGFGNIAGVVERRFNRVGMRLPRPVGSAALLILVGLPTLLMVGVSHYLLSGGWVARLALFFLATATLYWALGWRSLVLHVRAVADALAVDDLPLARTRVGYIVSRNCRSASVVDVRRAAIESALENASDAIVAPLFWFCVAGVPGVVLHRLSNTLDAMWGYKNIRYRQFGWAAARLDDGLNWVPARLTALSFAACGRTRSALRAWRQQAADCESPNAGPVMCAGAGALGLRLGGPALYGDQRKQKPWMGGDDEPENRHVQAALRLVNQAVWLVVLSLSLALALLSLR